MLFQPGPDSVGIFAISQSCSGVAARACGLVSLEPTKVKTKKINSIFFFKKERKYINYKQFVYF